MRRLVQVNLIIGIASCGLLLQAAEPVPLPLIVLARKQQFEKGLEAAAKPHVTRYLADLQRLADAATRAGNAQEAQAIQQEMTEVQLSFGLLRVPQFQGEWTCKSGVGLSATLTFDDLGNVKGWGETGRIVVEGSEIVIRWSNGNSYHFNLNQVGDVRRGYEIISSQRFDLLLTRKQP